ELREYLVAGDVSDVVLHDAAVAGGYVVPLPKHSGGAPEGIAEEQAHQVEQVCAEHHQVLSARPRILVAIGEQDSRDGGEEMMVLGTHQFELMRLFLGDTKSEENTSELQSR